jgi:hypothetical protein
MLGLRGLCVATVSCLVFVLSISLSFEIEEDPVLFVVTASSQIPLFFKSGTFISKSTTMSLSKCSEVETRYVCLGCCSQQHLDLAKRSGTAGTHNDWQFERCFTERKYAVQHFKKSKKCFDTGRWPIAIQLETAKLNDRMVGGFGQVGPAPDVRHQPEGNTIYPQS